MGKVKNVLSEENENHIESVKVWFKEINRRIQGCKTDEKFYTDMLDIKKAERNCLGNGLVSGMKGFREWCVENGIDEKAINHGKN